MAPDSISLSLPADQDLRPVVRHVLGGIGARFDLALERVDDLQLAVAVLLEGERSNDIVLQAEINDERLLVGVGPFDHDIAAGDGVVRLLSPLVDELRSIERDGGARYVQLELRRQEDR